MPGLESGDTIWFRPEEEGSAISALVRVHDRSYFHAVAGRDTENVCDLMYLIMNLYNEFFIYLLLFMLTSLVRVGGNQSLGARETQDFWQTIDCSSKNQTNDSDVKGTFADHCTTNTPPPPNCVKTTVMMHSI